jgi:hypothetical protein
MPLFSQRSPSWFLGVSLKVILKTFYLNKCHHNNLIKNVAKVKLSIISAAKHFQRKLSNTAKG